MGPDRNWCSQCGRSDTDAPAASQPEPIVGEVRWQEMVWRQAFNAAMQALIGTGRGNSVWRSVESGVLADAALVEWRKRWQR